jgi:hypothetical protein
MIVLTSARFAKSLIQQSIFCWTDNGGSRNLICACYLTSRCILCLIIVKESWFFRFARFAV